MKQTLMLGVAMIGVALACGLARAAGGGDEQKIRELDAAWSQAADGKDAAKCASFYSETGSMLPSGAPMATGSAKIQAAWAGLMALPGYSLTFKPTKIQIAKSRDMAYDVGTYLLKMNASDGRPSTSAGKYVVVWTKQKDGEWKVELDIFNSDK